MYVIGGTKMHCSSRRYIISIFWKWQLHSSNYRYIVYTSQILYLTNLEAVYTLCPPFEILRCTFQAIDTLSEYLYEDVDTQFTFHRYIIRAVQKSKIHFSIHRYIVQIPWINSPSNLNYPQNQRLKIHARYLEALDAISNNNLEELKCIETLFMPFRGHQEDIHTLSVLIRDRRYIFRHLDTTDTFSKSQINF